jgi:site-specific DNA-methyltransferase (adenine-specific)
VSDVLDLHPYRLHPTQKPISVLKPLIETFSGEGEFVLDPFAVPHQPSTPPANLCGSRFSEAQDVAGYM